MERTWEERVTTSLAKIESSMDQNEKDHVDIKGDLKELKFSTDKIPPMEIGLTNHLHAHDTLKKSFYYPIAVIVAVALLGVLGRLVLHIF